MKIAFVAVPRDNDKEMHYAMHRDSYKISSVGARERKKVKERDRIESAKPPAGSQWL